MRDQRLRSRMLRISTCLPTKIVDKRAIGRVHRAATAAIACDRRCARPACTVRSGADKTFRIKRLCMVCAGYPHACQQNLWTSGAVCVRGGTSRRVTVRERCFAGRRWPITRRVPHSKRRGQSVSDQALDRAMRRLSTCLPTKSVGKSRTTRIVCRASPVADVAS
ncbi:hypothetical protein C6Q14_02575 [Burkholderia ambifaria]|nr:hypothetical protein C6Q14_02575 [Burkholderia ambifaria]